MLALLLLAAAPAVPAKTLVADARAASRLATNTGITVQWIGWEKRGRLPARFEGGVMRLRGEQRAADGKGRLALDGIATEIRGDRFYFRGTIALTDTPDAGRNCLREGDYEFRITQNRRYWRLQQMEECDGLTDYVDIYF